MSLSTLALIFLSLCVGAGVWLVFLWAVGRGEFDDPEGPKYRMLDDEETPVTKRGQGGPTDE